MSERSEIEDVYREDGPRLWRALFAYAGDPEVASDTLAEVFAQALNHHGPLESPQRWIWRSAFKIAAGEMKRRRTSTATMPSLLAAAASYEMEEPAIELVAALAKLPRSQRVAVVLHHAAGYPVGEIAAILGTSSATVKVHLHRGRRRLAELLGEDHGP